MTEKVSLHRDELSGGVQIETGKTYEYQFGEPKGEIHVVVCDHEGHDPLPGQDYEISGPHGVSFKGKTGSKGEIDQALGDSQVPIDHYTLKVCEQEVTFDSRFPGYPPVHVRVPGMPKAPPPGPPPPDPKTASLLDLVCASLMLPNSTPNPGCDAAQDIHDRWMAFLANAFPAYPGLKVKDIQGAWDCLTVQHNTTCSHVLGIAFGHFGVPQKYCLGGGGVVPFGWKSPWIKVISHDNLPRAGDPYYIATPASSGSHAHHAIFDPRASNNPAQVGSYSGGWSPQGANASMEAYDAGAYQTPSGLALDAAGTSVLIGGPPEAHGIGVTQKKIWWYTDMWMFFRDRGSELRKTKQGLG